MLSQTDAKSQTTTFTYDDAGRLASKANGSGTATLTYSEPRTGYFNVGRLTTVAEMAHTALNTDYDALGRAVRQVRTLDEINYTAQRGYDARGRLRWITYPDNDTVGTPGA